MSGGLQCIRRFASKATAGSLMACNNPKQITSEVAASRGDI